jgi:hypothetical protein
MSDQNKRSALSLLALLNLTEDTLERSTARVAEAAIPSIGDGELRDLDHFHMRRSEDDELGDPITGMHVDGLAPKIHQGNTNLAPVSGVNETRGVDKRQTLGQRAPAPWKHETDRACGQLDGNPCTHRATFSRLDRGVLDAHEIQATIERACVTRQHRTRVDPLDKDSQRWLTHMYSLWFTTVQKRSR